MKLRRLRKHRWVISILNPGGYWGVDNSVTQRYVTRWLRRT